MTFTLKDIAWLFILAALVALVMRQDRQVHELRGDVARFDVRYERHEGMIEALSSRIKHAAPAGLPSREKAEPPAWRGTNDNPAHVAAAGSHRRSGRDVAGE